MLLSHLLRRVTRYGTLRIIDAEGRTHVFRGGPGRTITVRLHDKKLGRELFLNPRLRLGEAYMDGRLTVEDGSLYDFLDFLAGNIEAGAAQTCVTPLYNGFGHAFRVFQQYNPVRPRASQRGASLRPVEDALRPLPRQRPAIFLRLFHRAGPVDREAQAQQEAPHRGQAAAEAGPARARYRLRLGRARALSRQGMRRRGHRPHPLDRAARRWRASAPPPPASPTASRFELLDYREATGSYDRIVSVGMFEHVGVVHYPTFFRKVKELLAEDGVALLHSIGRADGPGSTNPWIRRYIFPGGYSPALSEVVPVVERTGLFITDIEVLRLHYAETLEGVARCASSPTASASARSTTSASAACGNSISPASEIAFRHQGHIVFQMQLAKASTPCR